MDRNAIVRLGVDAYHGNVQGNFSMRDSLETLRKALVDLNGGSTKLSYKKIRDGECAGLFSVVEEILQKTIVEGFQDNDFLFQTLIDFKSVALGDENDFYIPDNDILYVVSDVSRGNQALRRQRIESGTHIQVPTTLKGIKIYEELDRVLSGRVDFNELIDKVARSFKQQIYVDAMTAFQAMAETDSIYFPTAGSFNENTLVEIINHVEAATGKKAYIFGTQQALRKINLTVLQDAANNSNIAEQARNDVYTMGYMGKFNGTDCIKLNQVHTPGTNAFALDNDKLYIIAGDSKPIKVVNEGEATIYLGNPYHNADLSQEFLYTDSYGVAVAMSEKMGIYTMT